MLTALGKIAQIAFVTRDIQRSVDYFAGELGVGPWFFIERATFTSCRYRGRPSEVELAAAFANAGGMEFELMQLIRDDGQSMWRDALAVGFEREALHHWCIWPDDYDATLTDAAERGYAIIQDGATARGRFTYLQRAADADQIIELTESTPSRRAFQKLVADAGRGWDGSERLRTRWDLPADRKSVDTQ
jgi:catechol 2,3-dioxygenase-like lactoylglutathione lyase family enzyme